MVLDTIAFGDIQGEDTRNFTEANFVKIIRLAQLMVEYLLHVQELLADHKSELLQARATVQQKNEKIRSRFLWQRDALLQTRHELKQAKKTLQTYEVMLKMQCKNQASQSNQPQVRHCPFCEKVFESPHYLDLHVARKHQKKQEVTEDKILAVVSRAEEATATRVHKLYPSPLLSQHSYVKAEMSLAVQAKIQQLRRKYQADLKRTETISNTQVRTLQEDSRQSNNQLHEAQTQLENARLGSLYAVEKSKEKDNGPNQERLYELESKFSGLERRVKTLGQENSRLMKELNVAYAKVSDLQFAKRQSVFALETQVDDLRKENQHLKRTITKVHNIAVTAGVMGDKPDGLNLEAYNQSPENSTVDPSLFFSSRIHSSTPPKSSQPEVPRESFEIQENKINVNRPIHTVHEIPELILAIIEAKEPATQTSEVLDFQKLDNTIDLGLVQPLHLLNTCIVEDRFSPVHQSQPSGRPDVTMPLKNLHFCANGVVLTNMIEEEPIAFTPRERWTREPDKDQALLALARPISGRRRTEATYAHNNEEPSEQDSSADPEHSRHSTSAGKRAPRLVPQEMKYETAQKG